ncbi:MAG TPA: hypothetical protein DD490_14105 [Acidobacteria bacterium]|nr:hypothetical protein [Acidobacteriota bacterium]
MPYVIVQEDGDFELLMPLNVEKAEDWDELCLELVKKAGSGPRRQDGLTPIFNVFLLLDKEEFPYRLQRSALKDLLDLARRRIWGGRLFLVVADLPVSDELVETMGDLGDWMRVLLENGVSDLLQTDKSYWSENLEPLLRELRHGAGKLRSKEEALLDVADHREWRCVFLTEPGARDLAGELLGPLVLGDSGKRGDFKLLIVVAGEVDAERVDSYLRDQTHEVRLFATVKQRPSQELKDLCSKLDLDPPLVFRGELELWYFLRRLNDLRKWHSLRSPGAVQRVWAAQPEEGQQPTWQYPSLLFTSAFGPGDEQIPQWLAAADEVGRLLCKVPYTLDSQVELEIQPDQLIRALERRPNAWIHMGHGSARSGLHIPGREMTKEQWGRFFSKRDLPPLALFLTCDSHEVARSFAEAGAGVAIGFEGIVESDKTWYLAEQVLMAMFVRGMSRQVILEGFAAGARNFEIAQTLTAKPRAYYPRGRR